MSEFQYYEFQTTDRKLSPEQIKELSQISSRAKITSTQACFTYNYGDLKADPKNLLVKYFDLMLYVANWGNKVISFSLPLSLINKSDLAAYEEDDLIEINVIADKLIISCYFDKEEGFGWLEEEGFTNILNEIAPLRRLA